MDKKKAIVKKAIDGCGGCKTKKDGKGGMFSNLGKVLKGASQGLSGGFKGLKRDLNYAKTEPAKADAAAESLYYTKLRTDAMRRAKERAKKNPGKVPSVNSGLNVGP